MVSLPVVIVAKILGWLVAFVTWLAEIPRDEQERQGQKWQKWSGKNAWAKKVKLEELALESEKRLLDS
jgi:hypothetical protein